MKRTLQIILVGWELDRVMYGLKEMPPKKAIFITSSPEHSIKRKWSDITENVTKRAIESIKSIVETEVVYANYHDFDDCMSKIVSVLEANKNNFDEIILNVSSGSKPLIIASVLASQYYPINLFYVVPEEYNSPLDTQFLSSGAIKILELPTFELKELVLPTKKQRDIFSLLEENEIPFSRVLEKYSKNTGIKLKGHTIDRLRSLFFYHLKKLEKKRLVKLQTRKKRLFVSLTNTGRFLLKIMKKETTNSVSPQ